MADKTEEPTTEPTGTPEGTTPPVVVPETTPPPTDPLAGTPYEGKSAAEMAKMVDESQSFIKQQADDLGTARNEAAYYRSQQAQPAAQPEQKPNYEELDQRFLTNPAQTATGLIDEKMNQFGRQAQYQQAQMLAPMVEQQAASTYPVFKSLDNDQRAEVRRYMMATTDPRNGMNPGFATSAEAWNNAGWMIYGQAHPDGPPGKPINPVPPVTTETPQVTKPKETTGSLDKVDSRFIQIWNEKGFTPEQQERMAAKMIEESS